MLLVIEKLESMDMCTEIMLKMTLSTHQKNKNLDFFYALRTFFQTQLNTQRRYIKTKDYQNFEKMNKI